ncbi:protein-glutamate O-methyltransferase CheR [bacterium]|nr:protein-glutamate O-methyltransferase CheR [bacterium]
MLYSLKSNTTKLTLSEFERITELIYKRTGIRFEANKVYFLEKRLEKRMEELKMSSFTEYIRYLYFLDKDGKEFQRLIELLTINETYFFRDFPQLKTFAEYCLPDVAERKYREGNNTLTLWSAGCSSGEEPYTLAIILREMLEDINKWEISILATDIDNDALEKAKEGVYEERSVKDVPIEYIDKYFTILKDGRFKISDEIKSMVTFVYLNLGDRMSIRRYRNFDFIFCRNVLIYFDDISRKQVVDHFYIALNRGGYIFLGSSESLNRITNAFKLKRMGGNLVYVKE